MSDYPVDKHGRPVFAHDALDMVRKHAAALVEGREEPYAAAKAMWSAGFDGSFCEEKAPDPEHCKALWLLWGALTDWIELKPEQSVEAEESMRRAAAEWLEVLTRKRDGETTSNAGYAEIGHNPPEKRHRPIVRMPRDPDHRGQAGQDVFPLARGSSSGPTEPIKPSWDHCIFSWAKLMDPELLETSRQAVENDPEMAGISDADWPQSWVWPSQRWLLIASMATALRLLA